MSKRRIARVKRRIGRALVIAGIVSAGAGTMLALSSATGTDPFAFAASTINAVAAEYPATQGPPAEGQPSQGGGVLGERNSQRGERAGGRSRNAKRRNAKRRAGGGGERAGVRAGGGTLPREAQATRPLSLGGDGGRLPYTGISAIFLLGAGILMLGVGIAIRRTAVDSRYWLN